MSNVRQRPDHPRSLPFDEVELLRQEVEAYFGRRPDDWWPRREPVRSDRSVTAALPRLENARPA